MIENLHKSTDGIYESYSAFGLHLTLSWSWCRSKLRVPPQNFWSTRKGISLHSILRGCLISVGRMARCRNPRQIECPASIISLRTSWLSILMKSKLETHSCSQIHSAARAWPVRCICEWHYHHDIIRSIPWGYVPKNAKTFQIVRCTCYFLNFWTHIPNNRKEHILPDQSNIIPWRLYLFLQE